MSLETLLNGKRVAAVVCNQFGDTGKGKFTDLLAEGWADVIARGTGGNNAGHTVVVNGVERIFHLIPSGITQDSQGKINILGNGMVIDVRVLCEEMDSLTADGVTYGRLMVSKDAHVIMPYHIERDRAKNKSQLGGGIGSTGRGIGPCYGDKIDRRGITIADLFDSDRLVAKIEKAKQFYPESKIDTDEILSVLMPYAERIKPFVRNTVAELHRLMRQGRRALLEGAQGLLLSIEHGTYHYVTSSDCSLNGTASGVGIPASAIDLALGIVKYPFMTRVGGGPFPTELGGSAAQVYCADDPTKELELRAHGIPFTAANGKCRYDPGDPRILAMMNSDDELTRGIGLRLAAKEYGATTGRARRIGWTDAVMGRYSVAINGPLLVLTKVDSIAGMKEFSICTGYSHNGTITTDFNKEAGFLSDVQPVYRDYEGYPDIGDVKTYDAFPGSLRKSIDDFEAFTGGKVVIVSNGPERDQTVFR